MIESLCPRVRAFAASVFAFFLATTASAAPLVSGGTYDPPWASAPSTRVLHLDYAPAKTSAQNGASLKLAVGALAPGDTLFVGAGTWSVNSLFTLNMQGTAQKPIRIVGVPGGGTILTRSDASQNAVNVGSGAHARYLALVNLVITGGSAGLKIYDADNVWLSASEVHHCSGPAITANSANTHHLYFTGNEVHHTGGTGEGFYLGANNGVFVTHDTVVAENHVHDTGGTQGDGIELKQGSYANRIVANEVHDCPYPCILVYGTAGKAQNVIERNVCYDSGDNVMQVQGEALVRNNLLMNGQNGFESHDHQGQTRDLWFVHNTIVNTGRGADLQSWGGRANMVFANNAVYSRSAQSVVFGSGSGGVHVTGNVRFGALSGVSGGFVQGAGLADFANVLWDATRRNARPSSGSALLGAANLVYSVSDDVTGFLRTLPLDAGCYDGF